jgi:EAL domain-containing protein (putative c-di-GMP-specific phosphodiesterase class I)
LRHADIALYAAKAAGKNQWRAFQPSMISRREAAHDLRSGVATAIDSGTLTLRYQPVVSLVTGEACGFEALAWWAHPPSGTNQSAAAFARADKTRLGASRDMWILDHALADMPQLCTTPGRFVSVNISSGLLDVPGFAADITGRLSSTGTDPSSLMLEIPHDVSLRDHASALSGLVTLHDLGVRIALDNYGTGSATLANLRQPTIDVIKLDQSFVTNLLGIRNRRILNAVIGLANDLGTLLIATQVDDHRTLDDLVTLGCRHGQGILFAPAVPLRLALAWRGELPQRRK